MLTWCGVAESCSALTVPLFRWWLLKVQAVVQCDMFSSLVYPANPLTLSMGIQIPDRHCPKTMTVQPVNGCRGVPFRAQPRHCRRAIAGTAKALSSDSLIRLNIRLTFLWH